MSIKNLSLAALALLLLCCSAFAKEKRPKRNDLINTNAKMEIQIYDLQENLDIKDKNIEALKKALKIGNETAEGEKISCVKQTQELEAKITSQQLYITALEDEIRMMQNLIQSNMLNSNPAKIALADKEAARQERVKLYGKPYIANEQVKALVNSDNLPKDKKDSFEANYKEDKNFIINNACHCYDAYRDEAKITLDGTFKGKKWNLVHKID